jgi:hypothetical protein
LIFLGGIIPPNELEVDGLLTQAVDEFVTGGLGKWVALGNWAAR